MLDTKVFVSERMDRKVCSSRRERPAIRWKERIKEYVHERVADRGGEFEQARKECVDRERWRLFCHDHPLWGHFLREQGIKNYRNYR